MVRTRRGWIGESGRHSLAARGVHTKCPKKSSYYDVKSTVVSSEQLSPRTLAELKEMDAFFHSISKVKDGERVVTLYRGTGLREAKETEDYAKRGQPYTMYGKWWSTDLEEARHYAKEGMHFGESKKWALLSKEVKLSDLKPGKLVPDSTGWDRMGMREEDMPGFRAKYRDDATGIQVYFERMKKVRYSGYVVMFHGGHVDAKSIKVMEVGDIE